MRKLSADFLEKLKNGIHKDTLQYVIEDHTLDLELRGNYISIYYRGASILTIDEFSGVKPMSQEYGMSIPDITNIEDYFPKAKHIVDKYLCTVRNHLWEKDIQQQIVKENNYSSNSEGSDYFVIDIEYADNDSRFDIVALRWDSTSSSHKLSKNTKLEIAIFEVKQGEGSIDGKSGIIKHVSDFNKLKLTPAAFIEDMTIVFSQKRYLGLIPSAENFKDVELDAVSTELTFALIIVNYKSQSSKLRRELELVSGECNLIYANAMGYGLYHKNIISKEKFIEQFDLCK